MHFNSLSTCLQELFMSQPGNKPQPEHSQHLADEADIGSGEKTPAQHETDEMIKQIPPLPGDGSAGKPGPEAGKQK
jgi:hypothetical protein